jgi:hypothetical protein
MTNLVLFCKGAVSRGAVLSRRRFVARSFCGAVLSEYQFQLKLYNSNLFEQHTRNSSGLWNKLK